MSIIDNTAVIIYNHELSREAIRLKQRFTGKVDTYLFDSGSDLTRDESPHFDKRYPNIYYNGLLNETNRFLNGQRYDNGFIITSDVKINDIDELLEKYNDVFADSRVGVYAPSAEYSYHPQMIHKPGAGLREVTFIEGFCFAVRTHILDQLCPVDVSLNKYGYGTDSMLGYHALNQGYVNIIDHRITVDHPYGSGYDKHKAVEAKHNWIDSLAFRERLFYKITSKKILKNRLGLLLVRKLFGFER
ncbi:MAG: hypothetical protein R3281_11390 [Balneolaceae bacterium]|nr:hypothetical protein [Balneolaceae bacterium]